MSSSSSSSSSLCNSNRFTLPQNLIDILVSHNAQGKPCWNQYNEDYRYWQWLGSAANIITECNVPGQPEVSDYENLDNSCATSGSSSSSSSL